jgi:hypothetical protein|tara:strand:+ start:231 stop:1082 length:852 start_codon:yes stop_codon:yes gene_type:complete
MAEEQKQEEMELEVEVKEPEDTPEVDVVEDNSEDQFKKAESSTQKRIDRLTKKMRTAEREREEAMRYAQNVKSESDNLKSRLNNLDGAYVQEYSNRIDSQMKEAEQQLKQAMELGDTSAAVEAQRRFTQLAVETDRANQAKAQQKRQQEQAKQYAQQPTQQPVVKKPDPKAEDWASKNNWFGQDEAMTFAAFGIHKRLVEEEGFDATSDEYYDELDNRIAEEFPHKVKTNGAGSKRPAQTVASVSRSATGRTSSKKVRLTPTQVDIARRLGVPLEEYAKHVKG